MCLCSREMLQKTRVGSVMVAVRDRAMTVMTLSRDTKTPRKVPSRNFSIMKEPERSDLLVNDLLPRHKECNIAFMRECLWEIWTLWVGLPWKPSMGS